MHHWQDVVLAVSFLAFNIALLPSVFGKHKPAIGTSILTATFLIPGLIVYYDLSLWYSTAMTLINFLLWVILAFQGYGLVKKKSTRSKNKFWT